MKKIIILFIFIVGCSNNPHRIVNQKHYDYVMKMYSQSQQDPSKNDSPENAIICQNVICYFQGKQYTPEEILVLKKEESPYVGIPVD